MRPNKGDSCSPRGHQSPPILNRPDTPNSRVSSPTCARSQWHPEDNTRYCFGFYMPMILFNTFKGFKLHDSAAGKPAFWLVIGVMSLAFVIMIGHHHLLHKAGPSSPEDKEREYLEWLGNNLQDIYNETRAVQFTDHCFNKSYPSSYLLQTWQNQGLSGVSMYMNHGYRCFTPNVCQQFLATGFETVMGYVPGVVEPDYYIVVAMYLGSDNSSDIGYLLELSRSIESLINNTDWIPARTIVFVAWSENHGIQWLKAHQQLLHSRIVAYIEMDVQADTHNFLLASPSLSSVVRLSTSSVSSSRSIQTIQQSCGSPTKSRDLLNSSSLETLQFLKSHGISYVFMNNPKEQGRTALEIIRKLIDGVLLPIGVVEIASCLEHELERLGIFSGATKHQMRTFSDIARHFQQVIDENMGEMIELRLLNGHQINARLLAVLQCLKPTQICTGESSMINMRASVSYEFSDINLDNAIKCCNYILSQFP